MTCSMPCIHLVTPDSAACADVVHVANGLSFGFRVWQDADGFLSALDPEAIGVLLVEVSEAGRELAVLDRLALLGVDLPVIVLAREAMVDLPEGVHQLPLPLRPAKLRALVSQLQKTLSKSMP